ncbi:MAG: hypothetical protein ACI9IV_000033 [Paracoccaceae bacterium]|jgi:hypothetical protein
MGDQRFAARLKRIEAGQVIAPAGLMPPVLHSARARNLRRGEVLRNATYPLSILLAFCLGMLTVVIARYVRFQLFGVETQGAEPVVDHLLMDAAMSIALSFVIGQISNLRAPALMSAKGLGIAVCGLTMHMAVHRFPGLWGAMFSPDWVEGVKRATQANSILFLTFSG